MATKLKKFVLIKRTKRIIFVLICLIGGMIAAVSLKILIVDWSGACSLNDVIRGNRMYADSKLYNRALDTAYWHLFYARARLQGNYTLEINVDDRNIYYEFDYEYMDDSGNISTYSVKNFEGSISEYNIYYQHEIDGILIAFKTDAINELQMEFSEGYHRISFDISAFLILLLLVIILLIPLSAGAGYDSSGKQTLIRLYSIYSEMVVILILAFSIGIVLLFALASSVFGIFEGFNYNIYDGFNNIGYLFTIIIVALGFAAWLPFYLALVVKLKRRAFVRDMWICAVGRFLRGIFLSGSLTIRTAAVVLGIGILTMIPFIGIVTVPLAIWLSVRAISSILNARDAVVEEEMNMRLKAERLRTELIANVSHDLRTPLTSIITYIDLLKNEPQNSDKIPEYISVIETKAHRLKSLTDDLFEASKAASGNIPIEPERIDIVSLLTQGLGEIDENIQTSGLEFRVNVSGEPLYVSADGKLLWRVMENLVTNAIKYSLPGSRVYIDIIRSGELAGFEIKNISNDPLGVSADELTERFVRGDSSRTDGSSGLGLAIAKSFMEAMSGILELSIDGDLFKARVLCVAY